MTVNSLWTIVGESTIRWVASSTERVSQYHASLPLYQYLFAVKE